MCPLSFFVLGWWLLAAVHIYHVLPISERGVIVGALAGLCIGMILAALSFKNWAPRFYQIDVRLAVLVYLLWSAMALAFFMGLPFGTIALGAFAGVYVGRKQRHAGANSDAFARGTRNVGLFTALITGAQMLAIGLLALREESLLERFRSVTGLDLAATDALLGTGLAAAVCIVGAVVQFWCTKSAAGFAFRIGSNVVRQRVG